MEEILFIIFQFLGEILLQLLFEVLLEAGFHSMASSFKRRPNPVLASIGYFLWGAIAGGLSLLLFPTSFITTQYLKITNLIATPIILGLVMVAIGRLRHKQGKELVRLDKFIYAFLFALAMSLVRFHWAN